MKPRSPSRCDRRSSFAAPRRQERRWATSWLPRSMRAESPSHRRTPCDARAMASSRLVQFPLAAQMQNGHVGLVLVDHRPDRHRLAPSKVDQCHRAHCPVGLAQRGNAIAQHGRMRAVWCRGLLILALHVWAGAWCWSAIRPLAALLLASPWMRASHENRSGSAWGGPSAILSAGRSCVRRTHGWVSPLPRLASCVASRVAQGRPTCLPAPLLRRVARTGPAPRLRLSLRHAARTGPEPLPRPRPAAPPGRTS